MLMCLARRALQRGKDKIQNDFQEWLGRALLKGAGQAHKWDNLPNPLPPLQLVVRKGTELITDPIAVAKPHATPWKKEWESGDRAGFLEQIQAIKSLRDEHLGGASDWADTVDVHPRNIRRACRSFPSKTAVGLDNLFFTDIALLPDAALRSLGNTLKQCMATLALPIQVLMQLMVLLGKKSGGSRTIAILATFYRLLMRILAPAISEWDVNTAGPWDSALRGNSALRAHIARAADLELSDFEDLFIAHFLWDMRKFYDSIRVHKLTKQLNRLAYNPFILVLGLITHKSPRTLMVGPSCSLPIT